MAANVQFTNKTDVISAYEKMKTPSWAIWCGKAMNFSCVTDSVSEGAAELSEYLNMLESNGMPVYYTLCVYDLGAGEKITNKTPYDASFNFKLNESPGYSGMGRMGGMGELTVKQYIDARDANKLLLDEIKAMRMELKELQEGGEEEDQDDYGLGKVGKILMHPTVAPMAQQLVSGILGWFNGQPSPGRGLAGVPGEPPEPDKIAAAIGVLTQVIPDFPAILDKLALMAQKQPASLKMYCDALRGMQL